MKVLSSKKAKAIDIYLSKKLGLSSLVMMENAGIRVAEFVETLLRHRKNKKVAVLCGKGNNAGDGLVVSRQLICDGFNKVDTYIFSHPDELSYEAKINLKILKEITSRIKVVADTYKLERIDLSSYAVLVDALFGIGLRGEIKGFFKEVINKINASRKPVVSVDIPSGLDADKGIPLPVAVKADYTVTLGTFKRGLLINQGPYFAGRVLLRHIGFKL